MRNNKKIYILHGWAYSTEKWEPFVEELKRKDIESVLLKIPGLTAPLDEVWNLDNYVEWLKKIVDKEKGRVILLGHSNGGRISLAFSIKYPEKVSQLILINSAGVYHNEISIRLKKFIFGTVAKIGKNIKDIRVVRSIFYKFVKEHDYEKANPLLRQTMRNLINEDLSEKVRQISLPTLIVWGQNDKITPLQDGKLFNQQIKNSKFFIVPARHSPQFTNVQEVVKIIYANI